MPPKKKHRNALRGSTKMARLLGASKPAASIRSLKISSSVAGTSCAAAVITTEVVETTSSTEKVVSVEGITSGSASTPYQASDPSSSGISIPVSLVSERVSTPTIGEEDCAGSPPAPKSTKAEDEVTTNVPLSPQSPEVKSYANLLKASAQLEELGTPTEHVSGVPFVLIPDENIAATKEEFCDFVYARFHGDVPSMSRIIRVVNAIWARAGPRIFVHDIGDGAFLLRVTNAQTREAILAKTCWNIAGHPMFVALWSPDFTPEEAPLTSAVVPVELRNVPYLLFNKEILSRIATAVGKPVSLAPERKENFQVAKLYVKVDLTKPLPRRIISGFSNGKENEISVTYPWLPLKCEECRKFGHQKEKCKLLQSSHQGRRRSSSPSRAGHTIRNGSRHGRNRHPGVQ